jgi:DnaJ domain
MPTDDQRSSVDSHLRFPWREQREGVRRDCAWPGCTAAGVHRAPRARDRLREFVWFCLEHVREYNRGWDFFAGMSASEIEAHRRRDTTWHRPTWRFGTMPGADFQRWRDPFEIFGEGPRPAAASPDRRADQMRAVLEIEAVFTLAELKQRYKDLVKKFHPDLHGGDKQAEESLRRVIEAYTYLRDNALHVG